MRGTGRSWFSSRGADVDRRSHQQHGHGSAPGSVQQPGDERLGHRRSHDDLGGGVFRDTGEHAQRDRRVDRGRLEQRELQVQGHGRGDADNHRRRSRGSAPRRRPSRDRQRGERLEARLPHELADVHRRRHRQHDHRRASRCVQQPGDKRRADGRPLDDVGRRRLPHDRRYGHDQQRFNIGGASDASFKYRDTVAGTPTITAADHASVLTSATQQETVNPASASQIALSGSTSDLSSGSSRQFTATIQDAFGNTVTSGADGGVSVSFGQTTGTGSLSGTGSATASGGVATKNLSGVTAGPVTVRASATLSGPGRPTRPRSASLSTLAPRRSSSSRSSRRAPPWDDRLARGAGLDRGRAWQRGDERHDEHDHCRDRRTPAAARSRAP